MIRSLFFREGRLAHRDLPLPELNQTWAETPSGLVWFDLEGATEEETRSVLEGVFNFHPLTVEDCLTETEVAKLEDYGSYLHVVVHAVDYSRSDRFRTSELDLFLGRNFLVSFHRQPLRSVAAAWDRAQRLPSVLRGPDRLAHLVLDLLVENYQPAVAEIRAAVEEVEEEVLAGRGGRDLIRQVVETRKELSDLRRIVRPQREILAALATGRTKVVRPAMQPYFRDLQDELYRVEEQAGAWQDQLILSFRVHLNRSSSEANQGIKVLTALTALTLPWILVSTWFSMNFKRMAELREAWTYPMVAGCVLLLTVAMFLWLRRRRWI